jgi:hypothetical protein
MLDIRRDGACCDRCAGSTAAVRIARRRLLRDAVWSGAGSASTGPAGASRPAGHRDEPGFPVSGELPRAVAGRVLDVSPQVLLLGQGERELRLALTADATAWRGGPADPASLAPDDLVVVRLHAARRDVADRIWANIGRVTGTILRRHEDSLLVDVGRLREHEVVVVPARAASRIQVRYPNLEPGFLLDVIGLRHEDCLEALIPATPQPVHPVARMPAPPLVSGHLPEAISGSATWREPRGEPYGVLGVAYPALDPDTHCAEERDGEPAGQARMPYLSVGSLLRVRNDCNGSACLLPVTGCAPVARLFNDRCLTCGTSPRGRIAELSLASFVALGGELERGCFNATIAVGQ